MNRNVAATPPQVSVTAVSGSLQYGGRKASRRPTGWLDEDEDSPCLYRVCGQSRAT